MDEIYDQKQHNFEGLLEIYRLNNFKHYNISIKINAGGETPQKIRHPNDKNCGWALSYKKQAPGRRKFCTNLPCYRPDNWGIAGMQNDFKKKFD